MQRVYTLKHSYQEENQQLLPIYIYYLKDVEEILAQQLIRAYPALFPPTSHVLSGHTSSILSVALTPDGKWALTGSYDNTAQLWDLANRGSSPRVVSGHTKRYGQ